MDPTASTRQKKRARVPVKGAPSKSVAGWVIESTGRPMKFRTFFKVHGKPLEDLEAVEVRGTPL